MSGGEEALRIGIATCVDDRGRWRSGRTYHYIDGAYASAVHQAGGVAVYLPLPGDSEGLLRGISGLIIPGGDDLPPPRPYPGVAMDPVSSIQHDHDRHLLARAIELGIPVLGICYGMQLLALERGGELLYDIASDAPNLGPHRLPEADGRHRISIAADSVLSHWLDAGSASVNSLHHQGVAEPGDGLLRQRAQ